MKLNSEISAEEFKVFLQETEEQIELLDNNIVRLEKEQDNKELLQDVFRAAHTIKGSSAMVGLPLMAELTHVMESLLDQLRSGKLAVGKPVIDALLAALDTLKVLKDDISAGRDSDISIAEVVAGLQAAQQGRGAPPAKKAARAKKAAAAAPLAVSPEVDVAIQTARLEGRKIYQVAVEVNRDSAWASARHLQVLNGLARLGQVIHSVPSKAEVEQDKAGFEMSLIFVTNADHDEIQGELSSIAEVSKVSVVPYQETAAPGEAAPAPTATEAPGTEETKKREAVATERAEGQAFQSVRIDVQVLDNLMNIVEELVIDRSRIGRLGQLLASRYGSDNLIQDLTQTSDHIIKVINELQDNIMRVRMIPIGSIFGRFPRLVRDLAQIQHKEVDFSVAGGETELDRSIIEQIRDPLIHLLRNAIDHGVETPEVRKAAGKPIMATVRLAACQEQEHIVITIEDDGKGIDAQKVKESALRKGALTPEAAQGMSEAEALNLIFLPGVSTAEKITEVSGRGVGMDIVRTNIENLGGTIKLETVIGQGTKFTINLPLTVAITQGLMISSGGIVCAIPLSAVLETIKVTHEQIKTVNGREVIRLRDSIIPLLRLTEVLGRYAKQEAVDDAHALVIVVKSGKDKIGVVVDEVLEPQEIVVKPLGNYLGDVQGIAGVTIYGNGQIALIFDVACFAAKLAAQTREAVGAI